jgi:hypothetical protein
MLFPDLCVQSPSHALQVYLSEDEKDGVERILALAKGADASPSSDTKPLVELIKA